MDVILNERLGGYITHCHVHLILHYYYVVIKHPKMDNLNIFNGVQVARKFFK